MAKIKPLTVCPRCQAAQPEMKTSICPYCGYQAVPYASDPFGTPDYVNSQYKVAQEKISPKGPAYGADMLALAKTHQMFVANMRDEDKIDGMHDGLMILRSFLLAAGSRESLQQAVNIGKRIGALAKTLDEYIAIGGMTHGVSETTRPISREEDPDSPGNDGDLRS